MDEGLNIIYNFVMYENVKEYQFVSNSKILFTTSLDDDSVKTYVLDVEMPDESSFLKRLVSIKKHWIQ